MILCIDSGNSRIKWGVHDGEQWLAQGVVAPAEVDHLGLLVANWPDPGRVMLANVAGVEVGSRIREQLPEWLPVFCEVRSEYRRCGVTNRYRNPEQLGVDRWCALIGARSLTSSAAVVVMAGTATTIDTLNEDGEFLGGLILPGIDLMRSSLARETAALPIADGIYDPYPRCTGDAIVSGAIEAQAGAIVRAFARLDDANARCLLSGGNAEQLGQHLAIPYVLTHNLPLEGLKRLALND
ncbi:MAG: type III pantothenate kinase [Dechloromonas sp.]|nr:type III pantothenate kinase [Dechloromonas sp.]